MNREYEWIDGTHRLKIVVMGEKNQFCELYQWNDNRQKWEYHDTHDWEGLILLDGLGMLVHYLKLGKEFE